jgi:hypothetical protein
MRTTSRAPARRRAGSACSLALVLALAHGTTGCAHQLTNTEFVVGAVAVTALVGAALLMTSDCNELTTQCRPGEGRIVQLAPAPPWTGPRASSRR